MTAKILDGASVAQAIKDEVAREVAEYSTRGLRPGIAAVIVVSDSASQIYVSGKVRACEQLGLYRGRLEFGQPEQSASGLVRQPDQWKAALFRQPEQGVRF